MRWLSLATLLAAAAHLDAQAPAKKVNANRLAYLDELDPYYPHRDFPKLITPQWVGEKDVECVVVLAIDDMRDPKRYETFLRPILRRLKDIDGRAALSIMTNQVNPQDPQLQAWLKEGLSLECHTWDHPCPFFSGGFAKAKETYDRCVDLMHAIPNNKPVAFRMPCCDSLNTPSPRFWAEIFNKTTAKGNFLTIDSSVFNIFTSADPELPRGLVLDDKGQERFRRYAPADRSFVNTIENYPYPYVIGGLCWEFPCVVPSDWEAQHLQKPNNPNTVRDMKAALDCVVAKKGVFCLVFHPHGWIRNDQVVELIDHAVTKHGKKVKFLSFKEAQERLAKNLLQGQPLRHPEVGQDNGCRIVDLDSDGFLDIILGAQEVQATRIWLPTEKHWYTTPFLFGFSEYVKRAKRCLVYEPRFTSRQPTTHVSCMVASKFVSFDGKQWKRDKKLEEGLLQEQIVGGISTTSPLGGDAGLRLRDLDGDGIPELIGYAEGPVVLAWSKEKKTWSKLPFTLPGGAHVVSAQGKDAGLRFLDLDGDRKLDIVFSNENEYGIYLFTDMDKGWSKKVIAGKRGDKNALPMISRNGTNNGFWVHSGHFWWSNEDTVLLKDHVDRRSLKELLGQ